MEFVPTGDGLRLAAKRHYQLVPKNGVSDADLDCYRAMVSK
jgi:hypothetical protein